MGIPGLYDEIGKPDRVSLCKLAVDHYEQTGHKLRIAIDASIWLFQVKASRGGANPELRTLYYRLLRLMQLGIDPVLVFDGPARPAEKRNKKRTGSWESPRASQARALLEHFGFVYHRAPGEAEAECALLQREGIVDAVFSEDGDTLMFGATMTIRNWSSEERRGSKAPTHVDVYRASDIKTRSGLNQEGIILMALMSGGDYDTVGIKGCGITIAREAAKAGFGQELCDYLRRNQGDLDEWRERLRHEIKQNESGYFRRKSPKAANSIQDSFPSKLIAQSYLRPTVSPHSQLSELRRALERERKVDIAGLRAYLADKFEWSTLTGAKKFIRGMAPALLTAQLMKGDQISQDVNGLLNVCGTRVHFSSGGIRESRVEIRPIDLVPIDLESEPITKPTGKQGTVEQSDTEEDVEEQTPLPDEESQKLPTGPQRRRLATKYDPKDLQKLYLPELYIRAGAFAKLDAWEKTLSRTKPKSPRKRRTKDALAGTGMKQGAIESYFVVRKKTRDESLQSETPARVQSTPANVQAIPKTNEERATKDNSVKSKPNKADKQELQGNIRIRESLPGSWDLQPAYGTPRQGSVMRYPEVVDLT